MWVYCQINVFFIFLLKNPKVAPSVTVLSLMKVAPGNSQSQSYRQVHSSISVAARLSECFLTARTNNSLAETTHCWRWTPIPSEPSGPLDQLYLNWKVCGSEILEKNRVVDRDFGDCLNWKVCGYCLNWKVYFLKSLFRWSWKKMKERMKKWRLCVEEKMKNKEIRRIERRKLKREKRESEKERAGGE